MLGAWSAGDAKEFLFIAVLIPVYPAFCYETFNPQVASYPFIITVLVNTLLAIFPLVFLYSVYLSMKKKIFFRIFKQAKDVKKYFEISFVVGGAISTASLFGMPILALVVMVLLYRLKRDHRILLSAVALLVYISPSSGGWYARAEFISTYLAIVFLLIGGIRLLFSFISVIRKEALVEGTKITNLVDGVIIAEEIYISDGEVLKDTRSMMEKIKDGAKTGSLEVLRRRGVGTGAAGVTEEDIELLKGYVEKGLLEDRVKVKKSMPFAPVVLAGLAAALVIGDVMLAIRVWLYG
jgi:preflagellin peptidase FlaK